MRKVVLFIAMSLDGYIADQYGKVDWLSGQDADMQGKDTYSSFVQTVDTLIMGWNTYNQIVSELSPQEWVYQDLLSYVITHHNLSSDSKIIFTDHSSEQLVKELKEKEGRDIWICGGANIIEPLLQTDLIDEYDISIIPTILGSGIRLFAQMDEIKLRLMDTQCNNGIVELKYERR